jgi:hypothetical protein
MYLYVTWTGMALGAAGILGFILSYDSVGSPAQAAVNVHRDIPWVAYVSIFAWAGGLLLAWWGRRRLNAAVGRRKQELADAARAEVD